MLLRADLSSGERLLECWSGAGAACSGKVQAVQSLLLSLLFQDCRLAKASPGMGAREHYLCQPFMKRLLSWPIPCSLDSRRAFEKVKRKDSLANPEEEDRSSEHSSFWKLGAVNGTICHPHLLILHAILQLARLLPGAAPSFFHLRQGKT